MLLTGCTQNIVNIHGAKDKSLDAYVKMKKTPDGSEVYSEVHFGPGPGDIKFGPDPGDGCQGS